MAGTDPLSPERVAALVAPVIDRIRNAIAGLLRDGLVGLAQELGVDAGGARTMAMLRNLSDRSVSRAGVQAVLRYVPPAEVDAGIATATAAGLLEELPDATLRVTARGADVVCRLYEAGSDVVTGLWSGHVERIDALLGLTQRALDAAYLTGGPAVAVMAPPREPAGAPAAMVLAERLTPLRFHRFDAHVAAWQAAGLSVEEVQALGPGPVRDGIERETNRLAAPPYAALDPSERLELLGGLGALPN